MKTKKKHKKGYFSGGDIASIAPQLAAIAGDYASAAQYEFNPGQPVPEINFAKGISTGMIGILPDIIKKYKDMKQRSAYVASATPGRYQQGGPIEPGVRPRKEYRPSMLAIDGESRQNQLRMMLPATPVVPNPLQNLVFTNPTPQPAVANPYLIPNYGMSGGSSKSKSKDRLREYASGGKVKCATGGYMDEDNNPNDVDDQLSSSSFQVKGSPNTTDGNSYPQYNANLDHNEVVKTEPNQSPFVFSNKLKMPNGKSFAEAARKLEISTGKSEKVLKTNPNDSFARATIAHNENRSNLLAQVQEELATAQGLRGPSRNFATGGYTGGPDDPKPGQTYMSVPYDQQIVDAGYDVFNLYFDTATNKVLERNSKTGTYSRVPALEEFVKYQLQDTPEYKRRAYQGRQEIWPNVYASNAKVPIASTVTTSDLPSLSTATTPPETVPTGAFPYPTTAPVTSYNPTPTTPTGRLNPKKQSAKTLPPTKWDLLRDAVAKVPRTPYDFDALPSATDLALLGPTPDRHKSPRLDVSQLETFRSTNEEADGPMSMDRTDPTGAGIADLGGINQRFTIGDGLQALEVASKFGQLKGGAETERPYYDNTNITKENFDPSNALYQSQRNYQLGQNTLQNSSINQNRSFMNNLYVGKLNQDSDILAKYNQMNQGARTQQEQRQADQRRYNNSQTVYTNDVNARNRGAYKNAIDTAFTSLGNFGQNLNQKKQGYDALNILRASYPEVYARIMKGINGGQ